MSTHAKVAGTNGGSPAKAKKEFDAIPKEIQDRIRETIREKIREAAGKR